MLFHRTSIAYLQLKTECKAKEGKISELSDKVSSHSHWGQGRRETWPPSGFPKNVFLPIGTKVRGPE